MRLLASSENEADELLQDTAVVVFGHRNGPMDERSFPFWCQGVARHVAAHRRRTMARLNARMVSCECVEFAPDMAGDDSSFCDPEHIADAREQVASRLAGLEDTERMLLRSRFVEGETPSEIAKRWKVSPAAMRMRLMRLCVMLRAVTDECAQTTTPLRSATPPGTSATMRGEAAHAGALPTTESIATPARCDRLSCAARQIV